MPIIVALRTETIHYIYAGKLYEAQTAASLLNPENDRLVYNPEEKILGSVISYASLSPNEQTVACFVNKNGDDFGVIHIVNTGNADFIRAIDEGKVRNLETILWIDNKTFVYQKLEHPQKDIIPSTTGKAAPHAVRHILIAHDVETAEETIFFTPNVAVYKSDDTNRAYIYSDSCVLTNRGAAPFEGVYGRNSSGEWVCMFPDDAFTYRHVGTQKDGTLLLWTSNGNDYNRIVSAHPDKPNVFSPLIEGGPDAIAGARLIGSHIVVLRYIGGDHALQVYDSQGRITYEDADICQRKLFYNEMDQVQSVQGEKVLLPQVAWTGELSIVSFNAANPSQSNTVLCNKAPEALEKCTVEHGEEQVIIEGKTIRVPYVKIYDPSQQALSGPTMIHAYGGMGAVVGAELLIRGGRELLSSIQAGGQVYHYWLPGDGHYGAKSASQQGPGKIHVASQAWVEAIRKQAERGDIALHNCVMTGKSFGGFNVLSALQHMTGEERQQLLAVVARAPVTDPDFAAMGDAGKGWISIFGNYADPSQARYMEKTFPLTAIQAGDFYPPIIFVHDQNDPRVPHENSQKMVDALTKHATGGPFVLLDNPNSGHGIGSPQVGEEIFKRIQFLQSDRLNSLVQQQRY